MARRRNQGRITLGPFEHWETEGNARVKVYDRDAHRKAEDDRIKVATQERLSKAHSAATGSDRVQRLISDPLEILASRRAFARPPARNAVLFDAGMKFRHHWHQAGLTGIGAQDLNKVAGTSLGPAWCIPLSEAAAASRQEIRQAIVRLGDYLAKWVVAIAVEERKPEEAGRNMSSYIDPDTARAIAIECLRAGLTTLAEHWGLFGRGS